VENYIAIARNDFGLANSSAKASFVDSIYSRCMANFLSKRPFFA
jgi:hypothetical protein